MAAAIIDVYRALDQWAPFDTQMDFDNAGFLVGRGEREVRRVLVSLDITEAVAAEAGRWGAELIVSHHPVIFHPVKALTDQTSTGRTLLLLAEQGIGAVCAHTNLDAAQGGVNDCLARALELDGVELLCRDGTDGQGRPYGIGRVGTAPQAGCSAAEFAAFIKEKLSACSIRFVETGRPVRFRHCRREVRPIPGSKGPGHQSDGRGPFCHRGCSVPSAGAVPLPALPEGGGPADGEPPGGL